MNQIGVSFSSDELVNKLVVKNNCSYFNKELDVFGGSIVTKFPDISLTFAYSEISLTNFKIPWHFPDLEKNKFSLTFPWRVATLIELQIICIWWDLAYLHTAIFITRSYGARLLAGTLNN